MDADRRSNVSSFYGRPRSSGDALNLDHPTTHSQGYAPEQGYGAAPSQQQGRMRHDSASTFFGQGRPSNSGYNRTDYYDAGRVEPVKGGYDEENDLGLRGSPAAGDAEQGWNVFADFNNTGPRYSTAFGQQTTGYAPVPQPPASPSVKDQLAASTEQLELPGGAELVRVPGLGAEWQKSELRDMSSAGRREKRSEGRVRWWREFNRNERGLFGVKLLTRKTLVFTVFALCIVAGVVLAFTIPRVPGVDLASPPLVNTTKEQEKEQPTTFSIAPANFSFASATSLQISTNGNFLPLKMNKLSAQVFDLNTNMLVGTGQLNGKSFPAKQFTNFQLPLNFTYTANNNSDQTWVNWHKACQNGALFPGGQRPSLQFRLILDMDIAGLPTKHSTSLDVTNANCPVELSQNAP